MSTIQNLQDHIGELQAALHDRNGTIADQNRQISAGKTRIAELEKNVGDLVKLVEAGKSKAA
jgi:capsule polysaccharide export protein KpsE/RkpR